MLVLEAKDPVLLLLGLTLGAFLVFLPLLLILGTLRLLLELLLLFRERKFGGHRCTSKNAFDRAPTRTSCCSAQLQDIETK